MIDIHLYGKLRRFSANTDPQRESRVELEWRPGDTVESIVSRLGIPDAELGSNLFVNGRYADRTSPVEDGSRLGLFPDDMQLLYKWYFDPKAAKRED